MDSNQERYFFLSGLISLSLFVAFLFLAAYSLILSPKIEQFAMIQSDVINVSIALSEVKTTQQSDPEPQVEPQKSEEKVQPSEPAESVPEISDLFAQVKPEKTPKKENEDPKRLEQLNKLEKDILNRKETSKMSDKVSKVELAKPSVKMVPLGGSTGPIVNEYHAKIQGLVYTYFHPPAGTGGEVARVRMKISASGKLVAYKVIAYGQSGSFNSEVDWLKDRLSAIKFPDHPEGKEAVLEFILTAKE